MSTRTWCPSLGTGSDDSFSSYHRRSLCLLTTVHPTLEETEAKWDAAVAAHSGASANEVVGSLTTSFQRRFQKFDPAVVASNSNRLYWPKSWHEIASRFGRPLVASAAVVCLDAHAFADEALNITQLAVPIDLIPQTLSVLTHRKSKKPADRFANAVIDLVGLAPLYNVPTLREVLDAVLRCRETANSLHALTVCDAPLRGEKGVLADFLKDVTHLYSLSLVNCSLAEDMPAFLETLSKRELTRFSLARSTIGCGPLDPDRESSLSSFATYLKHNKFVTHLDLSDTNLDSGAVTVLMTALSESDTELMPQDMEVADDTFHPSTLGERVDARTLLTSLADRRRPVNGGPNDSEEDEVSLLSPHGEGDTDEDEDDSESASAAEVGDEMNATSGGQCRHSGAEAIRDQKQKGEAQLLKELILAETKQRASIAKAYVTALQGAVTSVGATMAALQASEKEKAAVAYCVRRSGWSRLKSLVLRGNHIGDVGAKQVALLLRDEVSVGEEEAARLEVRTRERRSALVTAFSQTRATLVAQEEQARTALMDAAHASAALRAGSVSDTHSGNRAEEEDEYARDAPPVLFTNVDDYPTGADNDDHAALNPEMQQEWLEWAEEVFSSVPITPVKFGMRSIRLLDLGSCRIGQKGLKALTQALRSNTVLEALSLRHNPLGSSGRSKTTSPMHDKGGAVSVEFHEFAEMLRESTTLQELDLGYGQLGPDHARLLAAAIRENAVLVTLVLEGNPLGLDTAYAQKAYPQSYLHDLWTAAANPESGLRHLNMNHCPIGECFWSEEAVALAAACGKLTSLLLSHVGLRTTHLEMWAMTLSHSHTASGGPSLHVLHLARNELATVPDGAVLGAVLRQCTVLEEVVLDDHPLLGSDGVAAVLEFLPRTLRRLSCAATGLTDPLTSAGRTLVIPSEVLEGLTMLVLADVEAVSVQTLQEWTSHLAVSARQLHYLSLWARGMSGKEAEVVPLFMKLTEVCPALLHVDCGYAPQPGSSLAGVADLPALDGVLVRRRMTASAL